MSTCKCVAKYLRLSLEDDDMLDESNSITNQRITLGQYITSNDEFKGMEVLEFKDDGYSGTNFDRPAFQEMMSLVREGEIGTIIVKDLSRFGRNHIEVAAYLEQIFPFLGIRFIAVNDNVDSIEFESGLPGMDVGFRNIINEHHSIETSEKVKCSFKQKMREGNYMGARAPYGYLKPDDNVTSLVINPETAPIVKRIFELYVDKGLNITQIAKLLNEEGIMCPGQYKKEVLKTGVKNTTNKFIWYPTTVRLILTTETYVGTVIGGKWKVAAVGSKNHVKTSEDEWIVVEGAHEAIITKELFDSAQEKLERLSRKKKLKHNNDYPLKGLLFCGGCGQSLTHITRCRPHIKCPRKFNASEQECLKENLYDEELNAIVLNAVKLFAGFAENAAPVLEAQKAELKSTVNEAAKIIRKNKEQIERLQHEKTELYMRYALEEISEDDYSNQNKKSDLKIKKAEAEIKKYSVIQEKAVTKLIELPEKSEESLVELVTGVEVLTREIALAFIRSIRIYGDKRLEIDWNFRDEFIQFVERCQNEKKPA